MSERRKRPTYSPADKPGDQLVRAQMIAVEVPA